MNKLEQIKNICDGTEDSRDIPSEAKEIAKENNIVIIVGGSDDLMYCYGADCYLSEYCEHSYGWDGDTLDFHDSAHKFLCTVIDLSDKNNDNYDKWLNEVKKERGL